MAAAAANTMAHQVPPMSLPQMPRIRPPRMLKGTPSPNTNPQPSGDSPEGLFWVQGRWRARGSNAAKNRRETQTRQAVKALRHETLGLNIYAYRHIRTNQVVYSLTRTLENNKILKQLVFHGKKTVPASVRRDMWTPYFSIHFPPTPAGALEGLFAFQKLRELSLQRQLSPPESIIRVTQEDIDVVKSKLGSPTDLQELAVRDQLSGRVPKLNEILPKKLQARRLMDQKATSVADAAFVLDWISSGPSPLDRMIEIEMNRVARHKDRSRRARRRIHTIREEEAKKKDEIMRRAALALQDMSSEDRSRLPLSKGTLTQLSMEHHGLVDGQKLVDIDQVKELKDAIKQWEAFVHVDMSNFDTDEWNRRQYVVRAAERQAIKEWFEEYDAPTTEYDSVWNRAAEARETALKDFEEETKVKREQQRASRREEASKQAEEAATQQHEKRKATGPEAPSLEQMIAQYKKAALDELEVQENQAAADEQNPKPDWADAREIKMYWADLNDGLFAAAWPQDVVHGQLAPYGVAKALVRETEDRVIEELPDDYEEGQVAAAEQQPRRLEIVKSKSVHVIGSGLNDGWMSAELATIHKEPAPWSPRPAEPDAISESEQLVESASDAAALEGAEKQDFGVYYEEPRKGMWARVRGIFGR
ncbi:hypothetical protein A1O1_02604 [Capronia coronata CBS 617.96]|uniref:Large ribosomal subunit protein mL67 n=1 Tax=Capronia coronata CBS 617.96 TaxID=1182541 RepID=W9YY51_9EURO|nr:uncharacterized protein A1O1_02604 [Capronia coronata CBS 617.96]EXJ94211.1 hypothetical protein A1O1_02604 [Capronia coronata CBS 617.96]